MACAASAEWPGLYHGVADIDLAAISACGEAPLLSVAFPAQAGPIERLFVLCRYEAEAAGGRSHGELQLRAFGGAPAR